MMKSLHDCVEGSVAGSTGTALERLMALSLRLADLMDRNLVEHGLTRARVAVIWRLHRDGPTFQRGLSQALGVTPRNITGLVDALEATGFVTRRPHPTDRRATVVSLTPQGRSAAEAMQEDRETFSDELFARLPRADLQRFVKIVDHLLASVGPTTLAADACDVAVGGASQGLAAVPDDNTVS